MKVARGALVPGVKNLKKILKFSLGLFELEQRLPGVKRALLMLQSEGPNFFPLYRGKTPPRQGGAPARGGGGDPRGPRMSKIQVYTQIDQPEPFSSLFSGIFLNDFSWGDFFQDSARARARARTREASSSRETPRTPSGGL